MSRLAHSAGARAKETHSGYDSDAPTLLTCLKGNLESIFRQSCLAVLTEVSSLLFRYRFPPVLTAPDVSCNHVCCDCCRRCIEVLVRSSLHLNFDFLPQVCYDFC
jgi:hypothetical protein